MAHGLPVVARVEPRDADAGAVGGENVRAVRVRLKGKRLVSFQQVGDAVLRRGACRKRTRMKRVAMMKMPGRDALR